MKKIGVTLILVMLVVVTSIAQPGQRSFDPAEMAKRQTEQIKKAVDLNEKQEKKVSDLFVETGEKMKALRDENQGGDFEKMREKMNEIRAEQDKKMKEILTEEQWSKYQKFQEERRAQRRDRRPGNRR
ncbi:hypothetical protein SAMN05444274_101207 [Mariniphaga anaerophila]|uniref:LTXXQ motif family protein n=1 Tax=Mariniphaga anaerophila TaxID=1484053 RepID=A0A1M4SZM9_9BACT|nr:hypothetical protein [Mariniphaga anaerophila]SHE37698.1 hypothetical protein SAMN05444274_101207 [Mariniphaga anaerophila]